MFVGLLPDDATETGCSTDETQSRMVGRFPGCGGWLDAACSTARARPRRERVGHSRVRPVPACIVRTFTRATLGQVHRVDPVLAAARPPSCAAIELTCPGRQKSVTPLGYILLHC